MTSTPSSDRADDSEFRPVMFSIPYRIAASMSDAEDFVQEAFSV